MTFQTYHFCLTELQDVTFKRLRHKEFEIRRMRTVSASMEYKPLVTLIPGSPGEHQCGVYNPKPWASLISGSPGEHQCGVYNPRASLVPRLPWLAPVRSTTPGLALFPGSLDEHQYGVQAHGYPCPGEHQQRVQTHG